MKERTLIIVAVVCLAVSFGLGMIAGYFGPGDDDSDNDIMIKKLTREADGTIAKKILEEIKAYNIRENLRYLTSEPHLAGTPADFALADYLRKFWQDNGLHAFVVPFNVLLSYPNFTEPNSVVLMDGSTVLHKSRRSEEIVRPEDNKTNIVPHYNGYAPAGTPRGQLVYVNYARVEDFDFLRQNQSAINLTAKICIARYGKIFRGDKAKLAYANGCKGLILYSDPKDYATGTDSRVYPDTWWLPGSGVQRGTVKSTGMGYGDPLTPGYPATESAFQVDLESADIPKIPIQPIGYDDAKVFLSHLIGDEVPESWKGALNVTYRFGSGFANSSWDVQLNVYNEYAVNTTYNSFGVIEGAIEPDRYVLMGNHRDAWVFGSVDPSSGTASMMEISRAFAQQLKNGWRPRRTIIFCSWGAEEFGLLGSTEWVEEHRRLLSTRSVAYVNLDIAVEGNVTMSCNGIPSLYSVAYDAAKLVPNPNPNEVSSGRTTLYDTWNHFKPEKNVAGQATGRPKIGALGSGSDHAPLIGKIGVPSLDLTFTYAENLSISSYPPYHSAYDTFYLSSMIDPTFEFHQSIARVVAEAVRTLADTYILPFNFTEYAEALRENVELLNEIYGNDIRSNIGASSLTYLNNAVTQFASAAANFFTTMNNVDKSNPLMARLVNDQITELERMFIDPFGLPQREDVRHLVYAPSSFDAYSGVSFPGIADTIYLAKKSNSTSDWKHASQQMAAVTHAVNSATTSLRSMHDFLGLRKVPVAA